MVGNYCCMHNRCALDVHHRVAHLGDHGQCRVTVSGRVLDKHGQVGAKFGLHNLAATVKELM